LKSEQANQIVPYLPLAKRGSQATVPLEEIVKHKLFSFHNNCTKKFNKIKV